MNEYEKRALDNAKESLCNKRKVGVFLHGKAVNVYHADIYIDTCNFNPTGAPCEIANGDTNNDVIHAEISALNQLYEFQTERNLDLATFKWTMYVTHQPCLACQGTIEVAGTHINIVVVEQFMKFDSSKLAYDLVPALWHESDAIVITKGAQKYKPNNWKTIPSADIMRYYAAAERHMMEFKKFMEGKDVSLFDDGDMGIGTHHLMNARTNLGFLLSLTETQEMAEDVRRMLHEG